MSGAGGQVANSFCCSSAVGPRADGGWVNVTLRKERVHRLTGEINGWELVPKGTVTFSSQWTGMLAGWTLHDNVSHWVILDCQPHMDGLFNAPVNPSYVRYNKCLPKMGDESYGFIHYVDND